MVNTRSRAMTTRRGARGPGSTSWRIIGQLIARYGRGILSRPNEMIRQYERMVAQLGNKRPRPIVETPGSGQRRPVRRRLLTSNNVARSYRSLPVVSVRKVRKGTRKFKASKASMYGGVKKSDIGGIQQDPNCVYVGHATMHIPEAMRAICRAILRTLCRKAGLDFRHWDETSWYDVEVEETGVGDAALSIFYSRYNNQRNPTLTTPFFAQGVSTDTPETLIAKLYTSFTTNLTQQGDEVQWFKLVKTRTGNAAFKYEELARINCNKYKVTLETSSQLKVQNVTKAQGVTTGNAVENLINDVGNNPLSGMYYVGTGNGFLDKAHIRSTGVVPDASEDNKAFLADNLNGLIARDASTTDYLRYPVPPTSFLNTKSVNAMRIKPGQMKISKLYAKVQRPFNRWLARFTDQIGNTGAATERIQLNMGKCAMFAMRRDLDMRTNEKETSLGYELEWRMAAYGYESKFSSVPDIVQTSAVV